MLLKQPDTFVKHFFLLLFAFGLGLPGACCWRSVIKRNREWAMGNSQGS